MVGERGAWRSRAPTDSAGYHGGRGGGQRRGGGEAALGSAGEGGREHVMALASAGILLCLFVLGGAGFPGLGFLSWVVDPGGSAGRFGVWFR